MLARAGTRARGNDPFPLRERPGIHVAWIMRQGPDGYAGRRIRDRVAALQREREDTRAIRAREEQDWRVTEAKLEPAQVVKTAD